MLRLLRFLIVSKLKSMFGTNPQEDFSGLYYEQPRSYAGQYPTIPRPENRLSPHLLAVQWSCHNLYGEDMPPIAADLMESGFDTPSLRRLAGELNIHSSADVEALVGKTFKELSVPYPISENEAKHLLTRQIVREVISGKRSARAAANHLEIMIWGWHPDGPDLEALFRLNDEFDWDAKYRRSFQVLHTEIIEIFARLGAATPEELNTEKTTAL